MKYQRFIPLCLSLAIYCLGQIVLFEPLLFYSVLGLGATLIVLGGKYLAIKGGHDWLPLIVAPLIFFLSAIFYLAIISNTWLIQAILLLVLWFIFSYFKNLYYYLNLSPSLDQADINVARLDNLFMAGGFWSVFLAAAVCFMLPAFLSWPDVYTVGILGVILLLLFWQYSFLVSDKLSFSWPTALVMVLILMEIAWVLSLLPLSFNVLGLFMAIFYYFLLTILRLKIRGALYQRAWKLPFILSLTAIAILLLTSRWL